MSTWFDETVSCPSCRHAQTAKLARGVHVSRAPEARDQVIDRTFHRVTCASCGVRFVAKRDLVYTDMERKHWMQVALADQRPMWPELEQLARDVFERAFIGSPLASELREGFKVRLVFGVEELREKLVIWRAGLDDGVVECAKLEMFTTDTSLALAHRLLVETVDEAGAEVIVYDRDDRPTGRFLITASLLDALHDRRDELRRYVPELFGGAFVSSHRLTGHRYRMPKLA